MDEVFTDEKDKSTLPFKLATAKAKKMGKHRLLFGMVIVVV